MRSMAFSSLSFRNCGYPKLYGKACLFKKTTPILRSFYLELVSKRGQTLWRRPFLTVNVSSRERLISFKNRFDAVYVPSIQGRTHSSLVLREIDQVISETGWIFR